MRPITATINLAALRHNLGVVRRCAPRSRVFGVIKANAYGHGAGPVAREAVKAGVSFIALVTLQEAVTLRETVIETPILIMGVREPAELPYCV